MKALLTLIVFIVATSLCSIAHAEHSGNGQDRVSFGDDITVDERGARGDMVCAFCTVRLHGDASGDLLRSSARLMSIRGERLGATWSRSAAAWR